MICPKCQAKVLFLCPWTDVCKDCMAGVDMLGHVFGALAIELCKILGPQPRCRCQYMPVSDDGGD